MKLKDKIDSIETFYNSRWKQDRCRDDENHVDTFEYVRTLGMAQGEIACRFFIVGSVLETEKSKRNRIKGKGGRRERDTLAQIRVRIREYKERPFPARPKTKRKRLGTKAAK